MGQKLTTISEEQMQFIAEQKLFFVATAASEGRVNLSPKGMDSLRVLSNQRVIWLNVTGSGNETSAHIQQNPRMTVMFCAFDGPPLILRLYGKAKVIHPTSPEWEEWFCFFTPLPGALQIFDLEIDLVQASCGMAVPYYNYVGDRELLNDWAEGKGVDGIKDYWAQKNQFSLDGVATGIVESQS